MKANKVNGDKMGVTLTSGTTAVICFHRDAGYS